MKPIPTFTLLLATLALSAAQAATVYRCGNTYSQAPCADARPIEVGDARSAAQRAEARRLAADERRLAAEMRRDRLADERALKGGAAASLSGPARTKVAVIELHRKKKRAAAKGVSTTDFVAYEPAARK